MDYAWGEELLGEFDEFEVAVGGEGGGFDDDCAARQDGGGDLAAAELHGEVPGDDAHADAEGRVADDDLAVGVFFDDFIFHFVLGEAVEPGAAGVDFALGQVQGFALLGDEEVGEFFAVGGQRGGEVADGFLAFFVGGLGPGGEGFAGGGYGGVDVFGGGDGDFGVGLFGGGVDVVAG